MGKLEYKDYYRRHLPHFQSPGATLFLTFRLAHSLPVEVEKRLLEEFQRHERSIEQIADPQERDRQMDLARRLHFGRWDQILDTRRDGPLFLKERQIAELVTESLRFRDGKVYDLDAYCVMPNHVHLVCKPLPEEDGTFPSVSAIMHSLKLYTARQANLLLGRAGQFWQHESYDHVVRDEGEWRRILYYVINNPVKAGLVSCWEDWKYSYCKYRL